MKEQFMRTKMCPFHTRGHCLNGENCSYAHSEYELRPLPDLKKTKLCNSVTKRYVCRNPNCSYAHTRDDLRATSDLVAYKTSLCFFHKKGRCLNGEKCRFAHGTDELKIMPADYDPSDEELQVDQQFPKNRGGVYESVSQPSTPRRSVVGIARNASAAPPTIHHRQQQQQLNERSHHSRHAHHPVLDHYGDDDIDGMGFDPTGQGVGGVDHADRQVSVASSGANHLGPDEPPVRVGRSGRPIPQQGGRVGRDADRQHNRWMQQVWQQASDRRNDVDGGASRDNLRKESKLNASPDNKNAISRSRGRNHNGRAQEADSKQLSAEVRQRGKMGVGSRQPRHQAAIHAPAEEKSIISPGASRRTSYESVGRRNSSFPAPPSPNSYEEEPLQFGDVGRAPGMRQDFQPVEMWSSTTHLADHSFCRPPIVVGLHKLENGSDSMRGMTPLEGSDEESVHLQVESSQQTGSTGPWSHAKMSSAASTPRKISVSSTSLSLRGHETPPRRKTSSRRPVRSPSSTLKGAAEMLRQSPIPSVRHHQQGHAASISEPVSPRGSRYEIFGSKPMLQFSIPPPLGTPSAEDLGYVSMDSNQMNTPSEYNTSYGEMTHLSPAVLSLRPSSVQNPLALPSSCPSAPCVLVTQSSAPFSHLVHPSHIHRAWHPPSVSPTPSWSHFPPHHQPYNLDLQCPSCLSSAPPLSSAVHPPPLQPLSASGGFPCSCCPQPPLHPSSVYYSVTPYASHQSVTPTSSSSLAHMRPHTAPNSPRLHPERPFPHMTLFPSSSASQFHHALPLSDTPVSSQNVLNSSRSLSSTSRVFHPPHSEQQQNRHQQQQQTTKRQANSAHTSAQHSSIAPPTTSSKLSFPVSQAPAASTIQYVRGVETYHQEVTAAPDEVTDVSGEEEPPTPTDTTHDTKNDPPRNPEGWDSVKDPQRAAVGKDNAVGDDSDKTVRTQKTGVSDDGNSSVTSCPKTPAFGELERINAERKAFARMDADRVGCRTEGGENEGISKTDGEKNEENEELAKLVQVANQEDTAAVEADENENGAKAWHSVSSTSLVGEATHAEDAQKRRAPRSAKSHETDKENTARSQSATSFPPATALSTSALVPSLEFSQKSHGSYSLEDGIQHVINSHGQFVPSPSTFSTPSSFCSSYQSNTLFNVTSSSMETMATPRHSIDQNAGDSHKFMRFQRAAPTNMAIATTSKLIHSHHVNGGSTSTDEFSDTASSTSTTPHMMNLFSDDPINSASYSKETPRLTSSTSEGSVQGTTRNGSAPEDPASKPGFVRCIQAVSEKELLEAQKPCLYED